MDTSVLILGFVGSAGFGAGLQALVKYLLGRPAAKAKAKVLEADACKVEAEAADITVNSAVFLVNQFRARMEDNETRIARLNKENIEQQHQIVALAGNLDVMKRRVDDCETDRTALHNELERLKQRT